MMKSPDAISYQNFAVRTAFLRQTPARPLKITDEEKRAAARRRRIEDIHTAKSLGISLDELGAL